MTALSCARVQTKETARDRALFSLSIASSPAPPLSSNAPRGRPGRAAARSRSPDLLSGRQYRDDSEDRSTSSPSGGGRVVGGTVGGSSTGAFVLFALAALAAAHGAKPLLDALRRRGHWRLRRRGRAARRHAGRAPCARRAAQRRGRGVRRRAARGGAVRGAACSGRGGCAPRARGWRGAGERGGKAAVVLVAAGPQEAVGRGVGGVVGGHERFGWGGWWWWQRWQPTMKKSDQHG